MHSSTRMALLPVALAIGLPVVAIAVPLAEAVEGPARPQAPTMVCPADNAFMVALPDGSVQMLLARPATGGGVELAGKVTRDNGLSWSEPQSLMKLPDEHWSTPLPLLGRDGELHLFWMVDRSGGRRPAVDYFIDIWHARSSAGRTQWPAPRRVWEGYVGSINGMIQLRSGRLIVPFAYWVGGRPEAPPTGANITTVIYSDDNGQTWTQSSAALTAPCYAGYNGANYGACEPTVIELKDGRVWMIIRTQTGVLYESFSEDGVSWSETKPTRFCSSDSPACLIRTTDGRIVLFWNNCENTSRIEGQGVYTNRDALHAAISNDEGKTWRGYREICRDPRRNEPPPKTGDRGTSYPYAVPTRDGEVLVVTGQGHGRRHVLRIDPAWLCEETSRDDFSAGLDGWCVFKAFGRPAHWWRNRTEGARLIDHPGKPGAKVLNIRRPDEKGGDEAVWNFALLRRGTLAIRLMLQKGFAGGSIALADRFIQPNDDVGARKVLATLSIGADGRCLDNATLAPGQWYSVELVWDAEKGECQVKVDGKPAGRLTMSKGLASGVCYVRFRSAAPSVDSEGFIVESVEARP